MSQRGVARTVTGTDPDDREVVMASSKSRIPSVVTGFDVVCTVGRVEFGNGDEDPQVTAFKLIAEHGADGKFSFPSEDGGTVHVTVATEPPAKAAEPAEAEKW